MGKRVGRPAKLTPALVEEICRRLASEPVHRVFADPGMPSESSFYSWLQTDAEFLERSARARAIKTFRDLDEAERRLEESYEGEILPTDVALLREELQHARWKASRMLRKFYGEHVELSGPGGGPLRTEVVIVDPRDDDGAP